MSPSPNGPAGTPAARFVARVYLTVAGSLAAASAICALLRARPAWFNALVTTPLVAVALIAGWFVLAGLLGAGWRARSLPGAVALHAALVAWAAVILAGAFWAFTRVSVARGLLAGAVVFALASVAGVFTALDLHALRRKLGPVSSVAVLLAGVVLGGPGHDAFAWIELAVSVALAWIAIGATAQQVTDAAAHVAPPEEQRLRALQLATATCFEFVDVSVVLLLVLGTRKDSRRGARR